jgi:hypothetical protein
MITGSRQDPGAGVAILFEDEKSYFSLYLPPSLFLMLLFFCPSGGTGGGPLFISIFRALFLDK